MANETNEPTRTAAETRALREAFMAGALHYELISSFTPDGNAAERVRAHAAICYPMPRIERPRVERDPVGPEGEVARQFSVRDGALWWKPRDPWEWQRIGRDFIPTPERVRLWADLLENPTEWVDADDVNDA